RFGSAGRGLVVVVVGVPVVGGAVGPVVAVVALVVPALLGAAVVPVRRGVALAEGVAEGAGDAEGDGLAHGPCDPLAEAVAQGVQQLAEAVEVGREGAGAAGGGRPVRRGGTPIVGRGWGRGRHRGLAAEVKCGPPYGPSWSCCSEATAERRARLWRRWSLRAASSRETRTLASCSDARSCSASSISSSMP